MAQIKEIIAPVEAITKDEVLEQHLYECILTGDFSTLKAEQQAVTFVIERMKAQCQKLQDTYERMRAANDMVRKTEGQGIIFNEEDFTYINEQTSIITQNLAYYYARIKVIDDLLRSEEPGVYLN